MLSRLTVFFCAILFAAGTPFVFGQGVLSISYSPKKYTLQVGEIIPVITPVLTGAIDSITVTPTLPLHLIFDPATGKISGSPDELGPAATYLVRAYNSQGFSEDTLSIAIADTNIELPTISYSPKNYTLQVGEMITAITPVLAGVVDSVTVTPPLPLHLIFDPATGEISGSPDEIGSAATYLVRAYNSKGVSEDTLTIAIDDLTKIRQISGGTALKVIGMNKNRPSQILFSVPSKNGLREIRFALYDLSGKTKWSSNIGSGQVNLGTNLIDITEGSKLSGGVYFMEMRIYSERGTPVVQKKRVTVIQ